MRRRDLLKKVLAILPLGALAGCPSQSRHTVSVELEPAGTSTNIQRLIEGVNHYLFAVFTHTMSLHKRRYLEVTPSAVKEASYAIVAILNANVKNFRITNCELTPATGKVDYIATFFMGKGKVENYPTSFNFQILGGPGDPTHVEPNRR